MWLKLHDPLQTNLMIVHTICASLCKNCTSINMSILHAFHLPCLFAIRNLITNFKPRWSPHMTNFKLSFPCCGTGASTMNPNFLTSFFMRETRFRILDASFDMFLLLNIEAIRNNLVRPPASAKSTLHYSSIIVGICLLTRLLVCWHCTTTTSGLQSQFTNSCLGI